MATKQEFKDYMIQNKANLNQEALKGADMNMVYNEWRDTGSISKNYFNQPVTQTQQVGGQTAVNQGGVNNNLQNIQNKTLTQEQVNNQNNAVNIEAQRIKNKPVNDGQITQITPTTQTETKKDVGNKNLGYTTTDITYNEDKTPYDANKVISKAPQFTGADGKTYQTVRNSDNTLTTIDVTTGQPVTGKYTDAERDSIKQGFLKSPEQVQQETKQNIQLDPNNLFNKIRSGQVLTKDIQNTDEYKKQKQRVDNLGRFENMSAKDLSYAINNGSLLPGTQTYNDLKALNPNLVRDAENLNALNSALTTTEKSNTDVLTKISEEIFKIFNGDTTTLKTKLSENPEVVKLNQDMATKKNELNSLKDSINNAYRDIEKELSGSGATKGYIQALASRRTEDLTRDYNTKLNEYNTMAGQLQTITEMVGDEITAQEKQQEKQLKALEFAYGIAKDELAYKRGLDATQKAFENQKELLALQQKYKDADIQTSTITDPATGKISLINSKTGETIKTFDTGLAPTKTGQNYELKEFGGKVYRFNQTTGEYETLGGGTPTTYTPTNRYDFIKKSEGFRSEAYQDSTGKWTIGYGFTSLNGKPVKQGDTMTQEQADKAMVDIANKYTNFKNFVKVPLSEAQQTALNSFEYNLGQNIWSGTGKTIIDKINAGDFAGAGQEMLKFNRALNPKTGQKEVLNGLTTRRQREADLLQQTGGQTTYSQQADAWANNIMNGKAKLSDLSGKENIPLKNQVIQIMNQKSGGSTGKTQDNLELGLQIVSSLIEHPGRESATGVPNFFTNPFGYALPTSNARDFQATLKQFSDLQFLNAVPQMQGMGALSNAEGLKLSGALTKLQDTGISEEDFLKELNRVKEVMNKAYKNITGNDYGKVNNTGTTTQTNTATDYLKSLGY